MPQAIVVNLDTTTDPILHSGPASRTSRSSSLMQVGDRSYRVGDVFLDNVRNRNIVRNTFNEMENLRNRIRALRENALEGMDRLPEVPTYNNLREMMDAGEFVIWGWEDENGATIQVRLARPKRGSVEYTFGETNVVIYART